MIKNFLVLTAMVLVSSELFAQTLTVRGVRVVGTGCNETTATALPTADGQTLSVLFDNYSAEIGQGSENPTLRVKKKDCNILIDVDVPFGVQYAIQQVDYAGFAALPQGSFGYHRFTQVVPGAAIPSMREAQLTGPLVKNYLVSVAQKPGRSPWSKCNNPSQTLNLLSELMVSYLPRTTTTEKAQISLDSADMVTNSRFKIIWRRCQ